MKKMFFFLFLLMVALCTYETTQAQNITIRGTVKSLTPRDTISNVSVLVKGTNIGATNKCNNQKHLLHRH